MSGEDYRLLLHGFISGKVAPDWEPEDADRLLTFLNTDSGVKFRLLLIQKSLELSGDAIEQGDAHRCGMALGAEFAFKLVQNLSAVPTASGESDPSAGDSEEIDPASP